MSDHETLLRWLATAAARMSWDRRLRELGRFVCSLAILGLVAQVFNIFVLPRSVALALDSLLVVAALVVVALFAWRLARGMTLAQAAGAADARASLKDELKSAHWFAQFSVRDAFVDLLMTHAARTAQTLDVRRLFPLAMPNSILTAIALGMLAGALAWFSPRIALPVILGPLSGTASGAVAADGKRMEEIGAHSASPIAEKEDVLTAAWSRLEQLAKELPAGSDAGPIKRAVAAHDAGLAAQLLKSSQRSQSELALRKLTVRPRTELKSAVSAQKLLEALEKLANNEKDSPPESTTKAEVTPTVRTATRLRAQATEERRKISGTPAEGEVTPNNRLRAISRAGVGMREVAYGEGEAADAGSQTSVSGAATGDRTGRSQAGGSEGEHPNSSQAGGGDDESVLGERTERLIAQLEKMSGELSEDSKQQETDEEFYAATERQASLSGYESVAAQWRVQNEAVISPGETPLSYREAVKQYFLSQHAREE
jgi:hypothetical protein